MSRERYLEELKIKLPDEKRAAHMPRRIEIQSSKGNKGDNIESWAEISTGSVLSESKPTLLLGQSGNGKTTWFLAWAIQLLSDPSGKYFPLYLHCSNISEHASSSPKPWLKKSFTWPVTGI